jgi:hypothetical protein
VPSRWTLRLAFALLVLGNGLEPDRIRALVLVLKSGIRNLDGQPLIE